MRQLGDLRDRVELYRRDAQLVDGSSSNSWVLIGAYAAEVRKQSDKAYASGDARYNDELIFVTIRKPLKLQLTEGGRLDWNGQQYNVREVLPDTPVRGFAKLRCISTAMEGTGVC